MNSTNSFIPVLEAWESKIKETADIQLVRRANFWVYNGVVSLTSLKGAV